MKSDQQLAAAVPHNDVSFIPWVSPWACRLAHGNVLEWLLWPGLIRRGYTHERYRRIIDSIRRHMPDASISGDAIVGFPGETVNPKT